jgi:hypothetical protein
MQYDAMNNILFPTNVAQDYLKCKRTSDRSKGKRKNKIIDPKVQHQDQLLTFIDSDFTHRLSNAHHLRARLKANREAPKKQSREEVNEIIVKKPSNFEIMYQMQQISKKALLENSGSISRQEKWANQPPPL